MKNKLIILFSAIMVMLITLNSCQKSYITGDIQNVNLYSQTTTYAYLQSKPVFDTLVQCIDAAGLKDAVNATGTTFFALTNSTIYNYLSIRTVIVQRTINQNSKWGLDSLLYYLTNNKRGTRDSLKMYLFNQKLTYDVLTNTGKYYPSGLAKDTAVISYETTTNTGLGYNSNFTTFPKVLYFAHLYQKYLLNDANPSSSIPSDVGSRVLCSTTGINTSNGVVHVLAPSHSLFFNRYK